jgi:hypothetical protein
MSIYASPKTRNGTLNTIFNNKDYIQTNTGGGSSLTIFQTDSKYLQFSGVTSSSAQTTFQNIVDFKSLLIFDNIQMNALATLYTLTVEKLLEAKQSTDTLTSVVFQSNQSYSFNNGMVYSIISDSTTMNSVSFIDILTTINQSYMFTFILRPSNANSPYYIRPSSNSINVNGVSIPLYGLQNVVLPTSYTYLVQQISIIYNIYSSPPPQFIALTSVSAY